MASFTIQAPINSSDKPPSLGYVVFSAFLLIFAFPFFNLFPLAWIGLLPLLYALQNRTPTQAFGAGFLFGLHFCALLLYSIISITFYGYFLLITYLALFYALFALFAVLARQYTPIPGFLAIPILWTFMEEAMSWGFFGFTLPHLVYSQTNFLPLIQLASITGPGGVTFILVLINVLVYESLVSLKWKRQLTFLFTTVVIILGVFFAGRAAIQPLDEDQDRQEGIKVGIVQGNIDQDIKWDATYREQVYKKYISLSRMANHLRPDLLIWPETSVPFHLGDNPKDLERIEEFCRTLDTYFFAGIPSRKFEEGKALTQNSAILFSPTGEQLAKYDKMHLVPFSEHIPFGEEIPLLARIMEEAGHFVAGEEMVIFPFPKAEFGTLICFESIFPSMSRELITAGADFLVIITNDAWFGTTTTTSQHAAVAVLRAVENRTWVARAANTGISMVIDPYGRVVEKRGMKVSATINATIYPLEEKSFYTKCYWLFPGAIISLAVALIIWTIVTAFRERRLKSAISAKKG